MNKKLSDDFLRQLSINTEVYATKDDVESMARELLDARKKIELLIEDVENLNNWLSSPYEIRAHSTKCKRWRKNDPDVECTCGYQNDYDNHMRLMKEVRDE